MPVTHRHPWNPVAGQLGDGLPELVVGGGLVDTGCAQSGVQPLIPELDDGLELLLAEPIQ